MKRGYAKRATFTCRWQRDMDAYTNGRDPGSTLTHLLECVVLYDGIPQASRGGIDFGPRGRPYGMHSLHASKIELELIDEALAWMREQGIEPYREAA